MMRLLLDEHVEAAVQRELRRLAPELTVTRVGDGVGPPKETPDPELLIWCESEGALLVSRDRRTLPGHITAHLNGGHHIPGVLIVPPRMGVGTIIEELYAIAMASFEGEYADTIRYLPAL